jgi:hypothetical protein
MRLSDQCVPPQQRMSMFSDTPTWPAKAISQAQANSTIAAVVVGQDAALRAVH